ncbi:DUF1796 family putative cysteine peptidase [Falsiroseomonas bella]|uniref:DUF1796 family putative cysteine peptidase n=1 Tax=Falsiroseomonas bella TaxID=2184016 RepID=UPI001304A3D8|nr:DUF1796 family putative cysteine peptidase [Falsiroseomonas bella]
MSAHDLVFSLGPNCKTAWNTRAHFGVTQAYPFDWWITPARAMLRMIEPGFTFSVAMDDLVMVPPKENGEDSVYNRRLNLLHHHDFPRRNRLVTGMDQDRLDEINRKYTQRFARLRADIEAARAPLALLGGISAGWRQDPTGTGNWNAALNGRVPPGELIAGIRDRLGRKLRVLVIAAGEPEVQEYEGGVLVRRPDRGVREPKGTVPSYAEPVHLFRDAFAALGLESALTPPG